LFALLREWVGPKLVIDKSFTRFVPKERYGSMKYEDSSLVWFGLHTARRRGEMDMGGFYVGGKWIEWKGYGKTS